MQLPTILRQMAEMHGQPRPGYDYNSFYDLLARRGRSFTPRPLTPVERESIFKVVDKSRLRFPRQQCFGNAQQFVLMAGALTPTTFTYVEGFALRHIPILHGWVAVNGDAVFDPTLRFDRRGKQRLGDRVLGDFDAQAVEYLGMDMVESDVRTHVLATREFSSIIDDWRREWPLLKSKTTGDGCE